VQYPARRWGANDLLRARTGDARDLRENLSCAESKTRWTKRRDAWEAIQLDKRLQRHARKNSQTFSSEMREIQQRANICVDRKKRQI
jgi:hypothetical protein